MRPTGDHWPSPATGGLAKGTIGAGGGRCGTVATTGVVVGTVFGLRMVPAARAPPTFGWWWEYHSFSAQLTMEAPPCSRNHSAGSRAHRAAQGRVGERAAERDGEPKEGEPRRRLRRQRGRGGGDGRRDLDQRTRRAALVRGEPGSRSSSSSSGGLSTCAPPGAGPASGTTARRARHARRGRGRCPRRR